MVTITYARSNEGWGGYTDFLKKLIEVNSIKNVCEVGGGANPTLPLDWLDARGLRYTLLDVSKDELDKASSGYRKIVEDVCSRDLKLSEEFDFVFSRMLAEHVTDGELFHKNILHMLSPGGLAFHFFPTLYALPFLANRLFPERLSSFLLDLLAPRDRYQHAKFPAYYSWCRGPTKIQIGRFNELGYQVETYIGFFGHEGYYQKIPLLRDLSVSISNGLLRHPMPGITSYAYVILRKPGR